MSNPVRWCAAPTTPTKPPTVTQRLGALGVSEHQGSEPLTEAANGVAAALRDRVGDGVGDGLRHRLADRLRHRLADRLRDRRWTCGQRRDLRMARGRRVAKIARKPARLPVFAAGLGLALVLVCAL